MKTLAYLRVSTHKQDADSQKLAIMSYAQKEHIHIDQFIETTISTRKQKQVHDLDALIGELGAGDRLLVSELSRIGRSTGQIIKTIDTLIKKDVLFVAIKENINIDGKQDIQSKMLVTMFGLLAELERDLTSQRTIEGLERAKVAGKTLGRPKGTKGKSKLDGREVEITDYLDKQLPITSIAKLVGVAPQTMRHFIKSRKLEAGRLLKVMG